MKILVTGGNGQLGKCIWDISRMYAKYDFVFTDHVELDITNIEAIKSLFETHHFDYCINCAAYTKVDIAETEQDQAYNINAEAVKNLAITCKEQKTILMHISTDFVFDGKKMAPYSEDDVPSPINVYGSSKLKGEKYVQAILEEYFIIRTSWVYSEYGHNFVKTILRLAKERNEISVVRDQIGSPTYAGDLAQFLVSIIASGSTNFGIYNYLNEGRISWYEFAKKIIFLSGYSTSITPVGSEEYKVSAKRPAYSVMNYNKAQKSLNAGITHWEVSLAKCLKKMGF